MVQSWPLNLSSRPTKINTPMKIYPKNRALTALKTKLSAAFVVYCLGLGVASTANAQLTFTVDTFTTDSISITLNNSTLSLLGNSAPTQDNRLYLIDADNLSNKTWIDDGLGSPLTDASGFGQIGSVGVPAISAANGTSADVLVFSTVSNNSLVAGTSITTPFTHSVGQSGLFSPSNVTNFALYWGAPNDDGILQSIGSATAGSTSSAVPEPSAYAALLGLAALGCVFSRRRSRRLPQATS